MVLITGMEINDLVPGHTDNSRQVSAICTPSGVYSEVPEGSGVRLALFLVPLPTTLHLDTMTSDEHDKCSHFL